MTIQNIRIINKPPLLNEKDIEKVNKVFKNVIPKYPKFRVKLQRLFDLPTSLGLCAFTDETLALLCAELRSKLESAEVPDNKTYASDSVVLGNTTISRYTDKPNSNFQNEVTRLKNVEIGTFKVNKISLITTNAVCFPKVINTIGQYNFK